MGCSTSKGGVVTHQKQTAHRGKKPPYWAYRDWDSTSSSHLVTGSTYIDTTSNRYGESSVVTRECGDGASSPEAREEPRGALDPRAPDRLAVPPANTNSRPEAPEKSDPEKYDSVIWNKEDQSSEQNTDIDKQDDKGPREDPSPEASTSSVGVDIEK